MNGSSKPSLGSYLAFGSGGLVAHRFLVSSGHLASAVDQGPESSGHSV